MKAIIMLIVTSFFICCLGAYAAEPQLRLVTLANAADPIITFKFVFHCGSMADPTGKSGLAFLTANLMAEGSTLKNRLEIILKKLYPIAASYSFQVDREYIVFSGETHQDNIESYYPLLKEAILEPAFLPEDFERVHSQMLNYIQNTLRFANDEELGKAVFKSFVYRGTAYENPPCGRVKDLQQIILSDVKSFYRNHFTRANLLVGIGGNYPADLPARIEKDFQALPAGSAMARKAIVPEAIRGLQLLLVDKKTESSGIHIGFPISVMRGDPDFYALFLFNSWFGEHRNSSSHLYQVIREARGLNYGDYSYIEDFPQGGFRQFPPTNIYKRPQLFEIWIRPMHNDFRLLALRAALRELQKVVTNGLSAEAFALTKKFLCSYYLNFATTGAQRLGYRLDDEIYGLKAGYLENFRKNIENLTLEQVNAAIRRHLQFRNLRIVMVTENAAELKEQILANQPLPVTYTSPKPEAVLLEDKEIIAYPLPVNEADIVILPVEKVFE